MSALVLWHLRSCSARLSIVLNEFIAVSMWLTWQRKYFNDLKREERLRKHPLREGLITMRSFCPLPITLTKLLQRKRVLMNRMERFSRAHEGYHQILRTVEERQMWITALMMHIPVESVRFQWGVKIKPSFHISTPRVSRDERPSTTHVMKLFLPRHCVAQSPETKPIRLYVSTPFLDFRVFQLPKTEIVTFDGNFLNLFMKIIQNSVKTFSEDGEIRIQLLIEHFTCKWDQQSRVVECLA